MKNINELYGALDDAAGRFPQLFTELYGIRQPAGLTNDLKVVDEEDDDPTSEVVDEEDEVVDDGDDDNNKQLKYWWHNYERDSKGETISPDRLFGEDKTWDSVHHIVPLHWSEERWYSSNERYKFHQKNISEKHQKFYDEWFKKKVDDYNNLDYKYPIKAVKVEKSKIEKQEEELRAYKNKFLEQKAQIEKLDQYVKEKEKLSRENKILKRNLELLENDPEEYKRMKTLDPYNEENWDN
jgi:hypothetical protein